MTRRTGRRGLAAVWAVVVVAVVSALTLAGVAQFLAARRTADHYRHRVQAEWLARAGHEAAVGKLLAEPGYKGETVNVLPGGAVKVAVTADPTGAYLVACEATYTADGHTVVTKRERTYHRAELAPPPRPAG